MWIQLDNDYLNLGHVYRVRFNKGWKNGAEELVAELEGLIKGELQVFTRYRGAAARKLLDILTAGTPAAETASSPEVVVSKAMTNTLHDVEVF